MNYFDPKTAAERYSKGRPDFHHNTIRHIKEYLQLDKKLDAALDIACGTGLSTKALLEIATTVYGTDISQEMQLLSTNILNWIKYQNENRRLVKENFNLHEMVGQVLGILQSLARQKKLLIENRVDESTEIQQYYEPLKILVYNLLTNAIHFTEKGTITVSAQKINSYITSV